MEFVYFRMLLLAALLLFTALDARAQAWRPFRPGLIYSYNLRTSAAEMHTLRVDSAYATTNGDSVYAFNRVLRTSLPNNFFRGLVKSRNNLFGATLRWRPGQAGYELEAMPQTGVQTAVSWLLFPRAAVGSRRSYHSMWQSAIFQQLTSNPQDPGRHRALALPQPRHGKRHPDAGPARPGCSLQLTDALRRVVWSAPVPAGQSTAVVLAGKPAGLYLLHLLGGETAATWKLNHE